MRETPNSCAHEYPNEGPYRARLYVSLNEKEKGLETEDYLPHVKL